MKIDVEGHELSVLSGATKLLETQRPNVMVEVEQHTDRQIPLDTIIEFFSDYSYGGHFLRKGRWRRVEELDRGSTREMADRVARRGLATHLVLYARRYVHNFLFKPVDTFERGAGLSQIWDGAGHPLTVGAPWRATRGTMPSPRRIWAPGRTHNHVEGSTVPG